MNKIQLDRSEIQFNDKKTEENKKKGVCFGRLISCCSDHTQEEEKINEIALEKLQDVPQEEKKIPNKELFPNQEQLNQSHKKIKALVKLREFPFVVPGFSDGNRTPDQANKMTKDNLNAKKIGLGELQASLKQIDELKKFYEEKIHSFENEIKETHEYKEVKEKKFPEYNIYFDNDLNQPGITESELNKDEVVVSKLSTKYCFPIHKPSFMKIALHEMDHAFHRKEMIYGKRNDPHRGLKDELRVRINDHLQRSGGDQVFTKFHLAQLILFGEHGIFNEETKKELINEDIDQLKEIFTENEWKSLKDISSQVEAKDFMKKQKEPCLDKSEFFKWYTSESPMEYQNYLDLQKDREVIEDLIKMSE